MCGLGILGKLPSHGDFLCLDVAPEIAEPLNAWLAATHAAGREALGERWLSTFLEAPAWRFALAAGCCGPSTVAGIWLPSVDRVGRYFPLVLLAPLDHRARPATLLHQATSWYDALQKLAAALLEGGLTPAGPDMRLAAGDVPLCEDVPPLPWRMPFADSAAWRLAGMAPVDSLWWSDGSPLVSRSLLACSALPEPSTFAAMLDGRFAGRGWAELPR